MSPIKSSLFKSLGLLSLLWIVHLVDFLMGWELWLHGIRPGNLEGLWGILFAPVLHGSWGHLAANSAPLVVMITISFYAYPKSTWISVSSIWLLSGLLTWFLARKNIHIGFSGINHGLMFFLFTIGVLRKDHRSIALAMIVFFLYGGMVWSIFPNDPGISFELHFFGGVSGVVMAFVLRNRDYKPAAKVYSWELENDEKNDSETEIGDSWKITTSNETSDSPDRDNN